MAGTNGRPRFVCNLCYKDWSRRDSVRYHYMGNVGRGHCPNQSIPGLVDGWDAHPSCQPGGQDKQEESDDEGSDAEEAAGADAEQDSVMTDDYQPTEAPTEIVDGQTEGGSVSKILPC